VRERLAQPPFAQRHDGQLHGVYGVAVAPLVVAGQGDPAQGLGAFLEHLDQVGEDRIARLVTLVQDLERRRQDRLFGVAQGDAPVQAHQGRPPG
jgi:hypothetical protein